MVVKSYKELIHLKGKLEEQINEYANAIKDGVKLNPKDKCKFAKAKTELKNVNEQIAKIDSERPY